MARLSDKQSSPIKLVLARAAMETAWDNPSELNRSLENAKQSMLEKTAEFLKGGSAPAQADKGKLYGEVGRQFAGVAQLVKGDNPPINAYLDQLAKLKAKLAAISSTDEPGPQARARCRRRLAAPAPNWAIPPPSSTTACSARCRRKPAKWCDRCWCVH